MALIGWGFARRPDLVERMDHADRSVARLVEDVGQVRYELKDNALCELAADLDGLLLEPAEPVGDLLLAPEDRDEHPPVAKVGGHPHLGDGDRDGVGGVALAQDVADLALHELVDSDDAVGHGGAPGRSRQREALTFWVS